MQRRTMISSWTPRTQNKSIHLFNKLSRPLEDPQVMFWTRPGFSGSVSTQDLVPVVLLKQKIGLCSAVGRFQCFMLTRNLQKGCAVCCHGDLWVKLFSLVSTWKTWDGPPGHAWPCGRRSTLTRLRNASRFIPAHPALLLNSLQLARARTDSIHHVQIRALKVARNLRLTCKLIRRCSPALSRLR